MSMKTKKPSAVKEFFRKQIVTLKRNPQNIPMAMLLISFVYYSLNLTNMSNTTAKIQGAGMGLCQFCIMLFSLLSIVSLMNAFPSRKKPVYPMVVLTFVMFGIMVYADIHYSNGILAALTREVSPIVLDVNTIYIANAYNMLRTFMILLAITAVLILTLPIYSKWIRKINTSVDVEDNGDMAQIEIEE